MLIFRKLTIVFFSTCAAVGACSASGTRLNTTEQEDGGPLASEIGPPGSSTLPDLGMDVSTDGGLVYLDQGENGPGPDPLVPVLGHEECWEGGRPGRINEVPWFNQTVTTESASYLWWVTLPVEFGCLTYRAAVSFLLVKSGQSTPRFELADAGYNLEACNRCPGPVEIEAPDYGFREWQDTQTFSGNVSALSLGVVSDDHELLSLSCFSGMPCESTGYDGGFPALNMPVTGEVLSLAAYDKVPLYQFWRMHQARILDMTVPPRTHYPRAPSAQYYVRDRHRGSTFSKLRVFVDVPSGRAPIRNETFVTRCRELGFEMHPTCLDEAGSEDALERFEIELPNPPRLLLEVLDATWAAP